MADDVVLNKAAIIERCVARVREVHAGDLNLQRACEASIDLAMHLVRIRRLGVPQESRDAFDLLRRDGLIEAGLAERLEKMVGFRNVAVHAYDRPDVEIVRSIVREKLGDFLELVRAALTWS